MNSRAFMGTTMRCVCAFFLIVSAGMSAFAQAGRGSISGLVTDPGGALIQGAKVVLLNPATGVLRSATVTTSAGLYTFISLNPGVYKVTASQTGFKSVAQEKITVNLDELIHRGQHHPASRRHHRDGYRHRRRNPLG